MTAMISLRRIEAGDPRLEAQLADLLVDAVHHGASVGFLAPLDRDRAHRYWRGVFDSLGPALSLWVAEDEGRVVGSVQLALCEKENGRHRAEVQKLFVLSASRGQGIAAQLLAQAEADARAQSRTLLILDTLHGSTAERVYQRLGWKRAGEIPDFAATPDGELRPTVFYFKFLRETP